MHKDALKCIEIQSGVLIIKGWATQRKAKKIQDKIITIQEARIVFLSANKMHFCDRMPILMNKMTDQEPRPLLERSNHII